MFFVYLIQSDVDKHFVYTGFTPDLRRRFKKHNLGLVRSTKLKKPFRLAYYESYASKQDAIQREQHLKLRAKAFTQLRNRIKNCFEA